MGLNRSTFQTFFFWFLFCNVLTTFALPLTSNSNETFDIDQYNSLFGLLGNTGYQLPDDISFTSGDVEQWVEQPLDHFSMNKATWKQRYFVNFEHFGRTKDAPVFLYLGGEDEVTKGYLHWGQMYDNAKIYKAAIVMLEHRYYGESHPTKDTSTENLKYLSSKQAIMDALYFIGWFKRQRGFEESNKWIVFGGSYPGNLATWARLKYPNIITGAVASSAPVLAKLNFKEYLKVVTDELGPKCAGAVKLAMGNFTELLKTTSGKKELDKKFNLCTPLETANSLDLAQLVSSFSFTFDGAVQNKDNTKSNKVTEICSKMTDESKPAIDRLANVVSSSSSCKSYSYNSYVRFWKYHLNFDKSYSHSRLWMYQTCTEFGYFKTSDHPDQPFGNYFSSDFFIQHCKDIFGAQFDRASIEKAVNETNAHYGGTSLTNLSNVVFVNGAVDPWHELSVLKTDSKHPTVIPILINETSHCRDMLPRDSLYDPQPLKDARKQVQTAVGQFLKRYDIIG